jgi:hypothetical protein
MTEENGSKSQAIRAVRVAAQWARLGRAPYDVADRVLECSNASLSSENFHAVLERYSPGNLEDLPQVTVSWFADRSAGRNYVAMAIHMRPADAAFDAGGREFVQVNYFCMDFEQLANAGISYLAMHDALSQIVLPLEERRSVRVTLPVTEPEAAHHPLAAAAAALLLTDRPVCILGADRTEFGERLKFVDEVASLLPYGMRSRLSASTWANSTYRAHKLRLFFSNADRQAGDHELNWDQHDRRPAGINHVDGYLNWLDGDDLAGRLSKLAGMKDQAGFSWQDVAPMLWRLGLGPDRGRVAQNASQERESRTVPTDIPTIEELLVNCGTHPDSLGVTVDFLRHHPGNPPTEMERLRYREILRENQLLSDALRIRHTLREEFYDLMLQLGFDDHLSYEAFCDVEDCSYRGGHPRLPHKELAQAIDRVKTTDQVVRILLQKALAPKATRNVIRDAAIEPENLISMIADESLRPHHGRIICGLAITDLTERSDFIDKAALTSALREHGYLTRSLDRLYPDLRTRTTILKSVLRVAQGQRLDDKVVQDLLVNSNARSRRV